MFKYEPSVLPGWPLPEVALEQPGPGEGLPAQLTPVVEAVREHVHGQGRHAHVVL